MGQDSPSVSSKISSFVQDNLKWIIAIAFAIILIYFDARYTSNTEFLELKVEVKKLKAELEVKAEEGKAKNAEQDNEIEDIGDRQEKKLKLSKEFSDKIVEELDALENSHIELKTEVKFMHKED